MNLTKNLNEEKKTIVLKNIDDLICYNTQVTYQISWETKYKFSKEKKDKKKKTYFFIVLFNVQWLPRLFLILGS